jgi:hypothetical protein
MKTKTIKNQMKALEGSMVFYKMNSNDEVTYDLENEYDTLKKKHYVLVAIALIIKMKSSKLV